MLGRADGSLVMEKPKTSGLRGCGIGITITSKRGGDVGARWRAAGGGGATMSSTQSVLGSIVSLWRYPVKSMMGEELNAAEITKGGLLGDRAYALIDTSDGKVATAKNPRKWPQLFDFRAALAEAPRTGVKVPPVRITLPDGTIVNSERPDLHQILSKVRLAPVLVSNRARDYAEFIPRRRPASLVHNSATRRFRMPSADKPSLYER